MRLDKALYVFTVPVWLSPVSNPFSGVNVILYRKPIDFDTLSVNNVVCSYFLNFVSILIFPCSCDIPGNGIKGTSHQFKELVCKFYAIICQDEPRHTQIYSLVKLLGCNRSAFFLKNAGANQWTNDAEEYIAVFNAIDTIDQI